MVQDLPDRLEAINHIANARAGCAIRVEAGVSDLSGAFPIVVEAGVTNLRRGRPVIVESSVADVGCGAAARSKDGIPDALIVGSVITECRIANDLAVGGRCAQGDRRQDGNGDFFHDGSFRGLVVF